MGYDKKDKGNVISTWLIADDECNAVSYRFFLMTKLTVFDTIGFAF